MGQYYHPTVLDKDYNVKGWLYSHEYNNGLKLMEHSYLGNNLVNAVLSLILDHPMRIAWIGDYSNDPFEGDEVYQTKISKEEFMKIYLAVYGENKDVNKIKPIVLGGLEDAESFEEWFLVNHTRKTYVDLGDFQQKNGWDEEWSSGKYRCAVHPLSLLTACGNDRGGGDYHNPYPDYDKVGLWAFDLIEFSKSVPFGYACEEFKFKEEM